MELSERPQFSGILRSPIPKDESLKVLLLREVADMLAKSAMHKITSSVDSIQESSWRQSKMKNVQ